MNPSLPSPTAKPRGSAPTARRPAVIFDPEAAPLPRIAALSLLDRLVVCLHRAGMNPILVVSPKPPVLHRARKLGIVVQHTPSLPAFDEDTLFVAGQVLAGAKDLQATVIARGRLVSAEGQPLPVGWLPAGTVAWSAALDTLPPIRATGVTAIVTDSDSATTAERRLWASLTSSSDGWVDRRFNRPVGRLLSRLLIHTPISPNQISLAATVLGVCAGGLLADGRPALALAGALLLQFSAIVDCVDGDVARVLYKESPLGKWLDIVGDQVVHISVFLGIGIGLWRAGSAAPVIPLGLVATAGVILSFLVILRALRSPAARGDGRLQRLIDATTNRDFSVLLIVCAALHLLDGFLWAAALGSHLFWLVALGLQIRERSIPPADASGA